MEYFKFPVVLMDLDYENIKKEKEVLEPNFNIEYTIGEAEIHPECKLIRLQDSWLPTEDNFHAALDGEFTACSASFESIGSFDIPMSKEKFKRMYDKFMDKNEPKKTVIYFTNQKDLQEFLKNQENEQATEESAEPGN
jgi:hypothetical protein